MTDVKISNCNIKNEFLATVMSTLHSQDQWLAYYSNTEQWIQLTQYN